MLMLYNSHSSTCSVFSRDKIHLTTIESLQHKQMSFHFLPWSEWDNADLVSKLKEQITEALNSGEPNPLLRDKLRVTDLSFGDKPPNVKLKTIVKCSLDEIELEFDFSYDGNGYIKIDTIAQINALSPVERSFISYSNLTGSSIMSRKPLVMPLQLHICELLISGTVMVRLNRVSKGSLKQWKMSVQLLSHPLKQIVVNNNFQEAFPGTKQLFTNLLREQADKAIKELMDRPKLIDINTEDKSKEEVKKEGSVTVTTTELKPRVPVIQSRTPTTPNTIQNIKHT
ncbi:mitochondrial distribution and morphology protein 34 [Acrasis kona]|uniref:Mitochondrial distribution and morphology protein 34 n=1 Tax=Acrasis kona TaxID=1008807 RepID=A0AAW2ZML7_9EUKA